jgi:hypothetical protein
MANALDIIVPQILAQGLAVLRENIVMPFLVNRGYSAEAAQRGDTVTIPVPSAMTAQDVTASAIKDMTDPQFASPTSVTIPMDQWKKADFAMTDKDLVEIQEGYLPLQAESAVKALANKVDQDLLGMIDGLYGYSGALGGAGIGINNLSDVVEARKVLNEQLAPMDPRYMVVGPQGEAEMLSIQAFHDASFGVGGEAILEGRLTRRLGFGIAMDQNVGTQTVGSMSQTLQMDSAASTTLNPVKTAAQESTNITQVGPVPGDIIEFATVDGTYVVTSVSGDFNDGSGVINFEPGLPDGVTLADAVTTYPDGIVAATTYEANMAFHRDFAAFVTRPLAAGAEGLGTVVRSISDPESRLTLRLEISRENKQTRWCWDILYGFALIRRELGCRVGGSVAA